MSEKRKLVRELLSDLATQVHKLQLEGTELGIDEAELILDPKLLAKTEEKLQTKVEFTRRRVARIVELAERRLTRLSAFFCDIPRDVEISNPKLAETTRAQVAVLDAELATAGLRPPSAQRTSAGAAAPSAGRSAEGERRATQIGQRVTSESRDATVQQRSARFASRQQRRQRLQTFRTNNPEEAPEGTVPRLENGYEFKEESGNSTQSASVRLKSRQLALAQTALFEMFEAWNVEGVKQSNSREGRLAVELRGKETQLQVLQTQAELGVLEKLETAERDLGFKRTEIETMRETVIGEMQNTQERLERMKVGVETWKSKERGLEAEFAELLGENQQFEKELTTVYKRGDRSRSAQDDTDGEEADGEFDFEMDEGEDAGSAGCPPGCDRAIFEQVLEFKERKKQLNKDLERIQTDVEQLKTEHANLVARELAVQKELEGVDAEIAEFQNLKAKQLNTVNTVAVVAAGQVAADARESRSVKLFTNRKLQQVVQRISDIKTETSDARMQYKKLQTEFAGKLKLEQDLRQEVVRRAKELEEIQIVKFGQIVDLDKIEKWHLRSPRIHEAENDIKLLESGIKVAMADVERKIAHAQKRLDAVTLQNTAYIEQLTSLGRQQLTQELVVKAKLKEIKIRDDRPMQQERARETDKLKLLILNQRKEIAILKSEIDLFKVKGGHIYTVVTSADHIAIDL